MQSRRDFILKTVAGSMSLALGNPVFLLGQENTDPHAHIFIYLRGGADGMDLFPHVDNQANSSIISFFTTGRSGDSGASAFMRPNLILPRELSRNNQFCSPEIIPVTPTSQLGFHPMWERLRANITVNPTFKPQRIRCAEVEPGVPLDDYLIFRVMKGVGMLHFYETPQNATLDQIRINKSHFDTQAMSLLASTSPSIGRGFLGRAVYYGRSCSANDPLTERLRLVGFGNFTNTELGGDSCRDFFTIRGGLGDFSTNLPYTHLGFPETGCRSYAEVANPRLFTTSSNADEIRNLISALRTESSSELAQLVKNAYEMANSANSFFTGLEQVPLNLNPADFGRFYYAWKQVGQNPNDGFWELKSEDSGSINQIGRMFINICRFILSGRVGDVNVENMDKTVAVSIGGFDTHSNQLSDLPRLIQSIAGGLHGLFVTVFRNNRRLFSRLSVYIMTEFGRTVRMNSGFATDHGWGNHLLAIFGSPIRLTGQNRLDRELGPNLILTNSASHRDSLRRSNAVAYGRDITRLHLDIDPMHLCPVISMHAGLAVLLSRAFRVNSNQLYHYLEQIMGQGPSFYCRNYLDNNTRLWTEFLEGIPGWN